MEDIRSQPYISASPCKAVLIRVRLCYRLLERATQANNPGYLVTVTIRNQNPNYFHTLSRLSSSTMANIFDGADCGPSNALSSVVKHAEVDRSLQRVRKRASNSMATYVLTAGIIIIIRIALEDLPRLRFALFLSTGYQMVLSSRHWLASSSAVSSSSRSFRG